jgi:hypothetical protein
MMNDRRLFLQRSAVLAAALPLAGLAQTTAAPRALRLRGTIEALSDTRLTLRDRSGERVELAFAPNLSVTEVFPVNFADVRPGTFVGVGGIPQADGSQRAIAVLLFPEAMRGTGEGHYPFDFLPESTMTNATVADVVAASDGRRLQLRYKAGETTVVVPPEAPVFSLRPGDRTLLAVGNRVSMTAQELDGQPTVLRISAGRNGFAPPY